MAIGQLINFEIPNIENIGIDTKIKSWMASNRLKLNPSKTEIICAGICWTASALPDDSSVHRWSMDYAIIASPQLGRDHRRALTMGAHVDKLVGICFFHLRQLRMVRRTLDVDAAHALVRALIHSRLDYFFFFFFRMLAQSYTSNNYTPTPIPLLYNPFTIVLHKSLCAHPFRAAHTPAC